jgi:signal transduction histidine kinase
MRRPRAARARPGGRAADAKGDEGAAERLIHELRVHRVELEIQNEELRRARLELEASLARYAELFRVAPVGYATLDERGVVGEVNLRAAALLEGWRSPVGRPLAACLGSGAARRVEAWLAELRSAGRAACDVTLAEPGGRAREVHLDGVREQTGEGGGVRYLAALADVTEQKEAERRLRALAARLDTVREEEQARIARDLHDDMGQLLTAVKINVRSIERRLDALEGCPSELLDRALDTAELVDRALASTRRIAAELRPGLLDRLGLEPALRQEVRKFEARTGLAAELVVRGVLPPIAGEAATALYRIAQEALTNVARHAGARRVSIALAAAGGLVSVAVEDDGRGLRGDPPAQPERAALGIAGMRERAQRLGGDLRVVAGARGGTMVTAVIPLAAAPPAEADAAGASR